MKKVKKKDRSYYKRLAKKARQYYCPNTPCSLRVYIHMVRKLENPDLFEYMLDRV